MLELLQEPAAIALMGTFFGGVALKQTENFFNRRKPANTWEANHLTVPQPKPMLEKVWFGNAFVHPTDPFECQVWETRHIEANPYWKDGKPYGEPLPVASMSVCEDKKCGNCLPTRKAKDPMFGKPKPPKGAGGSAPAKPAPGSRPRSDHNLQIKGSPLKRSVDPDYEEFLHRKYNDPRYKDYSYKAYLFQERLRGAQKESDRIKVELERKERKQYELQAKVDADAKEIRKLAEHVSRRYAGGRTIDTYKTTKMVPQIKPATYFDAYDKKPVTEVKTLREETFEIHADDHDGPVKTWTDIYDPDTNEYLGGVHIGPGGESIVTKDHRGGPVNKEAPAIRSKAVKR